ncbi:MAG: UDP-N-acetylglucosamine 1-carboxyvinyltransferase [Acidimicrobiia bacterium]
MAEIIVTGGNALAGNVSVLGAKNAVLKQQVAALLAPGKHMLENVPHIADVGLMSEVLSFVGATCELEDHTLVIDVPDDITPEAPLDLVRQMRASILVLGPLLARCGQVRVALPGGDDLGARPIDMHIEGLRQLGVDFELRHGVLEGHVADGLVGAEVHLDFPSVGATENILLAAVLARGETVIENAAREPELEDLAAFLNAMGANISGAGTSTIRVLGVPTLNAATHRVVPDRIEAGTYAVAAAITAGEVVVSRCVPDHLRMELRKLQDAGCRVEAGEDWIRVLGPKRPNAVNFATLPFPGFATDLHPQVVALLAVADGTSVITENVYEARFKYIGELARLGADISTDWQHAVIRGVPFLSGCPVVAPDIRAGAALILAALRAEGYSTISAAEHVDRGYEGFVDKLAALGADIEYRV